jgi:organic hydroperoxide reductase OsmC/OhrA
MGRTHSYEVRVRWTGNRGTGTSGYRDYGRDHLIEAGPKAAIEGSSDPAFRGDAQRYNPEELLVASVSACHMLWYLHLCAAAGVAVTAYEDDPLGTMVENADGSGRFTGVVLRTRITLSAGADRDRATALHTEAHRSCFIANSVKFPIECQPIIITQPGGDA